MPSSQTLMLAGSALAAAAGLLLASQLVPGPGGTADGAGGPLGSESSVAVLVVHDKNLFREVRNAIDSERVVAEGEHAFALEEGRIVALESVHAGPLIGALGWSERSVELIDTRTLGGRDPRRSSPTSVTPPGLHDIATLSKKDSLSLSEAIRVLNASP